MENTHYKKHFGLETIKRSLVHFLIGKGINIFLSLAILLTLARVMDQSEYAVFIFWQALVMVIALFSTAGIQSSLRRFLPELRSKNNNILVYRMLSIGVGLRFLTALSLVCLLIYLLPSISSVLSVPNPEGLLSWFLLIGSVRVTAMTLAVAFDSLLWQKVSQLSLVSSNIFRLAAIVVVNSTSNVTLHAIVLIELAAELIYVSLLLGGYYKMWRTDSDNQAGELAWWQENQTRVTRFGVSKYVVSLSRVFYGSAPNRLLAAQYVPIRELAIFGFVDSMCNLVRRFAPVALMVGFIRPVFVAKYTADRNFSYLAQMSDTLFRINTLILTYLIAALLVLGEPIIDIVTSNKYGEASHLLVGFFILLIFEGFRLLTELLIEVTELNSISIVSNVIQSFSLLIALPLFSLYGLWAIVIANITGTVLASVLCIYQLRKHGYRMSFDIRLMSLTVINGLITWAVGLWLYNESGSMILVLMVTGVVFLGANFVFRPLTKQEITLLLKLVSRPKLPKLD